MSEMGLAILLIAVTIAFLWTAKIFWNRRNGLGATLSIVVGVVCVVGLGRVGIISTPNEMPPAPRYRVRLSANRDTFGPRVNRFDSKTYKGPTGMIIFPFEKGEVTLDVRKDGGNSNERTVLPGKDGVVIAPTGKYRLLSYIWFPHGNGSGPAGFAGRFPSDKPLPITITKGAGQHLDVGSPLQASITVGRVSPKRLILDFHLIGHAGESCVLFAKKQPGFEIRSKSGDMLQRGSFEYG